MTITANLPDQLAHERAAREMAEAEALDLRGNQARTQTRLAEAMTLFDRALDGGDFAEFDLHDAIAIVRGLAAGA